MDVYSVAHVHGIYMFPATRKVFKTEKGAIEEYKRLSEKGLKDLKILKAQWIEADFVEYEKLKENEK